LAISVSMPTDTVVQALTETLTPYIGATMARSALRAQCERLGLDGDVVSGAQAEGLIVKVGNGLNVFLGREKAALVVEEMRRTLGPAEMAR
jgi:hypothetical protein